MAANDNTNRDKESVVASLTERVWRFFSSVRLAFILILVITGLSLIGILVAQMPSGAVSDSQENAWWLANVAQPKYGAWTPLLSLFRLFGVFSSPWFLAAGALLMVNILVCSLNRWSNLRRLIAGGPVKLVDDFYGGGTNHFEISTKAASAKSAALSSGVLGRHHYRIRQDGSEEKTYIAADKNRYYRLGTFLSHLSLILFILGYLIGSVWGFRDTNFIVAVGTTRDVGNGTGLSLALESFKDEYYPDGSPSDFRSEVVLYKDGKQVERSTVQVNHPLSYEGVRFFQSFFGPSAAIQVRDSTGKVILNDNVALSESFDSGAYQRNGGVFNLPQTGFIGQVISPTVNVPDPMIGKNELVIQLFDHSTFQQVTMDKLSQGVPKTLGGFEFTYLQPGKFSGFQVSRDPGNALIWIASAFFLLGVGMVLYFPHRQIWALVQSEASGGSRLLLRSTAGRGFGAAAELQSLAKEIESELVTDKRNNKE